MLIRASPPIYGALIVRVVHFGLMHFWVAPRQAWLPVLHLAVEKYVAPDLGYTLHI